MPLQRLDNACLNYGTQVLLDSAELSLDRGERLGLLGRNGAGKTTLLKVLDGEIALEDGERWLAPGATLTRLQQELPAADEISVYEAVTGGLAATGELLNQYHQLIGEGEPDKLFHIPLAGGLPEQLGADLFDQIRRLQWAPLGQ